MEMVLEHLKLQLTLLMMYLNQKLTLMEIMKSTQEHKGKLSGQMFSKVLTLLVMQFKMDKEIHWLTLGQNHLLQPETTTLPITISTLPS